MIRRRLGSTGLEISPLCLGGNVFGWTADQEQSFAILDRYVEAGGNIVDTADAYQAWVPGHVGGESETVIGRWLTSRRARDRILVATKVGAPLRPRPPGATTSQVGYGHLDDIPRRLNACLARLQTDHVDILYAHVDDETIPIAQYLTDFDRVIRAGKARFVAASNFRPDRLAEALRISRELGLARFVALSTRYSLLERREHEQSYADLLRREGLGYLPYWALAKGFLTGKYLVDRAGGTMARSDRARVHEVARYDGPRARSVLAALGEVAERHGSNPGAVALAWVSAQPGVTAPVVSTRTPEQLAQLWEMQDLRLTAEDLARLTAVSAPAETEPTSA